MSDKENMPERLPDNETQAEQERLKSTLWFQTGKIVDEETINLGVNATPQFIGSLTELVWAQIGNAAVDLESFANHAGRDRIKTDDVLLLARRNEGLESILKEHLKKVQQKNSSKTDE